MADNNTVLMEDVRIIFRNFEGKEGKYNKAGDRNFGVILPPDVAQAMEADGWNVKYLKPREEELEESDDPTDTPWLPVSASFDKGRPPRVVLITDGHRTNLDEETVEMLDWADITHVDLIVRPYHWEVSGRNGVKAYLQSMYVTIEEDELERKYREMERQQTS